ncbi:Rap1a/Tai family immunity protein [uncultured Sphingomonas sp.]|uniref:Rap1a/Tai family immunity protein n=1 Tax=uncultured Sphingomonas sp. TaxID=158754 RepID=UPI0025D51078|nr:Rap1a/Tai family immunity protein [uncultured Sphingomonas sp.]
MRFDMLAPMALLLTSTLTSPAQGQVSIFKTGNDLYKECSTEVSNTASALDFASCRSYIQGALDSYASARAEQSLASCYLPGVTGKQLFDVVIAYLRDHPAERHIGANYLVAKATKDLFISCPAKPQ